MYHTTGFTRDEIVELCARVHAVNEAAAESEPGSTVRIVTEGVS